MLGFDVFGAASIVEAAAHLDLAAPCAVAASRSWMDAIQMGNATRTAAGSAAAQRTDAFKSLSRHSHGLRRGLARPQIRCQCGLDLLSFDGLRRQWHRAP